MLKQELLNKNILYKDNPYAYLIGFKDAVKYIYKLFDGHRDIKYLESLFNRLRKEIMNEYKIYYTERGTVFNYCKAWVAANSEDEAKTALMENDWDKILDTEICDTEYDDDYSITEIESAELIGPYED